MNENWCVIKETLVFKVLPFGQLYYKYDNHRLTVYLNWVKDALLFLCLAHTKCSVDI